MEWWEITSEEVYASEISLTAENKEEWEEF